MSSLRHDPITQLLHWIVAAAVVAAFVLGLIFEDLPRGDVKTGLQNLHFSLGVLVLTVTAIRLAWRPFAGVPPRIETSPLLDKAAKFAHLALYLGLVAVPLVGMVIVWARGRGIDVFGLVTLPSPLAVNRPLAKTLEGVHEFGANALMLLAFAHALAAIGHQFVLKDGTLGRMLPFLTPTRT
jgi:cytochrome b561